LRRLDLQKTAFNAGSNALAATLAVVTLPHPVVGVPLTTVLAGRLVGAALVCGVTTLVLTWVVLARAQGMTVAAVAREGVVPNLVLIVANLAAVALGASAIVINHGHLAPWLEALVIGVLPLVVIAGNWLHLYLHEEGRAWLPTPPGCSAQTGRASTWPWPTAPPRRSSTSAPTPVSPSRRSNDR